MFDGLGPVLPPSRTRPLPEGLPESPRRLHVCGAVSSAAANRHAATAPSQHALCVSVFGSGGGAAETDRICFVLQPAQLLRGDVMVGV